MKRKSLLSLLIVLCLSACGFESFDERSAREAREYTQKQCPRRMDQGTMLDSMIYDIQTRTLSYCYTMEDVLDDKSVLTPEIRSLFRDQLVKAVANSIDLKQHKEHGVVFEYRYYSRKDKSLLMVEKIDAKEYR